MVTKKHCDYCDKDIGDNSYACYAEFGWESGLDDEIIECCSDWCFVRELNKRMQICNNKSLEQFLEEREEVLDDED